VPRTGKTGDEPGKEGDLGTYSGSFKRRGLGNYLNTKNDGFKRAQYPTMYKGIHQIHRIRERYRRGRLYVKTLAEEQAQLIRQMAGKDHYSRRKAVIEVQCARKRGKKAIYARLPRRWKGGSQDTSLSPTRLAESEPSNGRSSA